MRELLIGMFEDFTGDRSLSVFCTFSMPASLARDDMLSCLESQCWQDDGTWQRTANEATWKVAA